MSMNLKKCEKVKGRVRVVRKWDKTRTKQSFKDACDINKIMKRHKRSGILSHINSAAPRYDDVSDLPDYQTALNSVNRAKVLFNSLDPKIRNRFKNDPGEMIDFLSDVSNKAEAIELGLIKAPEKAPGVVEKTPEKKEPKKDGN